MAAKKEAPYGPNDRIRIEHPKTGESYGVLGSDFSKHYEAGGFRAVSYETGAPFRLSKAEQAAADNVPAEPGAAEAAMLASETSSSAGPEPSA